MIQKTGKNVLAIGDGRADREALHRVTEERLHEGIRLFISECVRFKARRIPRKIIIRAVRFSLKLSKKTQKGCRQKNVKFLVKPALDSLKKELILLTEVVEHLIMTDDHIDIRITEDQLNYDLKEVSHVSTHWGFIKIKTTLNVHCYINQH